MSLNPVIDRLSQTPETLKANWTLPPEDAKFLYLLARIGGFKQMLELGTSIGFSTLHLALAASQQNGHVTTIDASLERQNEAQQNLKAAGLDSQVTFKLGEALKVLEELFQQGQKFDFMFLDAQKAEYIDYFRYAEKLMSSGGVLIADNTQSHRDGMQDFIQAISQSEAWESSDMPTPNGFILARRK
jgi:predicted O-methyltransferase YrrM